MQFPMIGVGGLWTVAPSEGGIDYSRKLSSVVAVA